MKQLKRKYFGFSRSKFDDRWTKWLCDDASKYPAPPKNGGNPRNDEWSAWVEECLKIAGGKWESYWSEIPGQRFAHEPYAWINPINNSLQIRQHGGWDI